VTLVGSHPSALMHSCRPSRYHTATVRKHALVRPDCLVSDPALRLAEQAEAAKVRQSTGRISGDACLPAEQSGCTQAASNFLLRIQEAPTWTWWQGSMFTPLIHRGGAQAVYGSVALGVERASALVSAAELRPGHARYAMNEPASEFTSVLSFPCPRCGHEHDDEYEVIDAARPTDWRCAACKHVFSVQLTECWHCAAETVTVALAGTEQCAASEVICHHCGERGLRHEDADCEEIAD